MAGGLAHGGVAPAHERGRERELPLLDSLLWVRRYASRTRYALTLMTDQDPRAQLKDLHSRLDDARRFL